MIRNSTENGEDSLHITVAVKFKDRNTFDYINSECRASICWMVSLFPHALIIAAGCCVLCSAAWFALNSHVLEEFSYLLQQCYKHAGSENTATESNIKNSASTKPTVTTRCTIEEHSPPVTLTVFVKQHEGSAPPSAIEEDRNRVGERLQNFIKGFDIGNCKYCCPCFTSCWKCYDATSEQQEPLRNVKEVKNRNYPNFFTILSYIIISIIQAVVASVAFDKVLELKNEMNSTRYECNINERIQDLVYDHFACSYSIIQFYYFSAFLFLVFIGLHMSFSWLKLVVSVVMLIRLRLCKTDFENIKSLDLKFLLKLVKFSNPAYVKPFHEMCKGSDKSHRLDTEKFHLETYV